MSAHDRYLAAYRRWTQTLYCTRPGCENRDGITALIESEYGQSWSDPEDCPLCGGDLSDDQPQEDDDE